jgi:hypothetical protein
MIPGDQLYEKQLGFSYWYVKHKLLLKNILIAALLIIIFILIIFDLYVITYNLVLNQKSYQEGLNNYVVGNFDYTFLRQFNLPPAILVNNIQTYSNNGLFDIVAEISNASTKWYATFEYQFQLGEKTTPVRKGFILPGENKKIMDLAVKDGNLVSNIIFSNISWQKEINFSKIYQEKFNFDFKNIKYIPSPELGVEVKIPVNRVSFEIKNLTAYNYKDINLKLFLKSAGQVVAVNQIPGGTLLSAKTKPIEVNFFQRLPKIESVEIIPEVNILDPSVFLKF